MQLSIFDRILIKKMLQEREREVRGISGFSLSEVRVAINILDKIEFSDDEINTGEIKIINSKISWEKDVIADIEFEKSEKDLVSSLIKNRETWELDENNLELCKKFEVNVSYAEDREHLIDLTLFQRLTIRGLIVAKNNKIESINDLLACLKIYKIVDVTEEEAKTYNIRNENGQTVWQNDFVKQFEFHKYEFNLIGNYIKKSENYGFNLNKGILDLIDKFKVDVD